MSSSKSNFFSRAWNRARALRTCRKLVVASDTRATIQQLLQQRKITDKAFDRLTEDARKREREALTFEEVYIAVLCVYKYSSRSNPSREYDVNLDGLLDREEFAEFIRKLTPDSLDSISLKLSGRPTILT
ncbi:uncharacterized protein C2845_PM15G20830 [Panicum miliaceum]|uniref:EF-hand domain-containing protein n=1 Tax=Panicum miliaceum TaxID=4540 RepID=A0A3L6Q797_PANMI|nr:uncharacterized protein C2845_PM15G20830 [Panicum miliaceum]